MMWPFRKKIDPQPAAMLPQEIEMTTTTTPTQWQQFVSLLETDILQVGGVPLQTLITAMIAANGNLALEAAALLQFNAAAPAAGITLAIEVQNQILQLALTKLQTLMAKPAAAPAA